MYTLVVFDMAGTTIDEGNVVYKTLHQAIVNGDVPATLDVVLSIGAGREKYDAIKKVLRRYQGPDFNPELADSIYSDFRKLLPLAYAGLDVKAMPHAKTVCAALQSRNISIVLNTGYDRVTANNLLQKIEWEEGVHYNALVTASDVKRARPYPDMIYTGMKMLGVELPEKVVKVGDSAIDIEEGKRAGCGLSIGITTGAHSANQLKTANPDAIIDSLDELLPFFNLDVL